MANEFKPGDVVKFARILAEGDDDARFVVVELRGDKVLVRYICNLPIPPHNNYWAADLLLVAAC